VGGFAFGLLVGFGVYKAVDEQPGLDHESGSAQEMAGPAGPRAPGQGAGPQGGGAAPMVGELNELKRRLEADPKDLDAATKLANMYYQVGMWDQSLQFYDIALALAPDDPNLLTDSGNVHRELGNHVQALERFRRAHEADPEHWQSLFNTVVVAAFDLKQLELADVAMVRLDELDPAPAQLPALKKALADFRAQETGQADAP